MHRVNHTRFSLALVAERLPWAARALLGCVTAGIAVALTYSIPPLRAFPLLLAFPTVILSAWFLEMSGGIFCALTETVLVDHFLTKTQLRFSMGNAPQDLRLGMFLLLSILMAWTIRRSARQRAQLETQELQQSLSLANAERELAEERMRAGDVLRDREDALQIALKANSMGLWAWDLKQGTIQWSEEVYRIVGREPGAVDATFDAWVQLIHPEDAAGVGEGIRRTREEGVDYHQQYRVFWPDGSVRWLESRGKCQLDGNGQLKRVVGVLADVTTRKHSDEAMLRAEKLAVAGRLAASVAHEINNPLEAVANLLYLVEHAESLEDAREQAAIALGELMRISQITLQTLKFHRQPGRPTSTKLSDIVQTVLTLFRGRLHATQMEAELRAEGEQNVLCMPGEVQQIFANLVSNAIEAMPQGGRLIIRIRPSLDWRDRTTQGMRITFCDSGTGMDAATRQRIFEPFFTTKAETGTGLGMWVVAQLVARHNGHMRVWSARSEGRSGTAFSLFLPFGDAPATGQLVDALAHAEK
jgi:PAS domain S-box-containing protein